MTRFSYSAATIVFLLVSRAAVDGIIVEHEKNDVEQDDYVEEYYTDTDGPADFFKLLTQPYSISVPLESVGVTNIELKDCKSETRSMAHLYANESVSENGALVSMDYDEDDEDYAGVGSPLQLTLKGTSDAIEVAVKGIKPALLVTSGEVHVSSKKVHVIFSVTKTLEKQKMGKNLTYSYPAYATGGINVFLNAGMGIEISGSGSITIEFSFDVAFSTCVLVSASALGFGAGLCTPPNAVPNIVFDNRALDVKINMAKIEGKVFAFAGVEVEVASLVSMSVKLHAEATASMADNAVQCGMSLNMVFEAQILKGATHFFNFGLQAVAKAVGFCTNGLDSAIFPDLLAIPIAKTKCFAEENKTKGVSGSVSATAFVLHLQFD